MEETNALDELLRLVEEVADDNTSLVNTVRQVLEAQTAMRADMIRELEMLRSDFQGALTFRTLKDVCRELLMPLNAMEKLLDNDDFSDPDIVREHVGGLVITLHSILSRMGAERIVIAPGEDRFDPHAHLCMRLVSPADSPFPDAPPQTVVNILEDGYTLTGKLLFPAKVEVQSEQ
jgi:molecular chaperone GrpE